LIRKRQQLVMSSDYHGSSRLQHDYIGVCVECFQEIFEEDDCWDVCGDCEKFMCSNCQKECDFCEELEAAGEKILVGSSALCEGCTKLCDTCGKEDEDEDFCCHATCLVEHHKEFHLKSRKQRERSSLKKLIARDKDKFAKNEIQVTRLLNDNTCLKNAYQANEKKLAQSLAEDDDESEELRKDSVKRRNVNYEVEEETASMSDPAALAEAARLTESTRLQTARDTAVITDSDLKTAIETVMNIRIVSEIPRALFDSGFQSWEDLEHLHHSQVDILMWWPPNKDRMIATDKEKPSNLCDLACLRQFIRYMDTKRDTGRNWSDIGNFDKTEFKEFRRTPQGRESVIASAPITSLDKQQILRDWCERERTTSDYEILTKDSQYPQWLIHFHAFIRLHHVADVIDKDFDSKNIIDTSDQQLWKEKQDFMWAVFTRVLQTNMGQYIIKQHLKDNDAREVWFALKRYHTDLDAKAIVADVSGKK